jgi:hypothetical protein
MDIYYYLYNDKNNEMFRELMNGLNIKYFKNVVSIFDKKYAFITISEEKRDIFIKLAMIGFFVDLPLYAFTPIN